MYMCASPINYASVSIISLLDFRTTLYSEGMMLFAVHVILK